MTVNPGSGTLLWMLRAWEEWADQEVNVWNRPPEGVWASKDLRRMISARLRLFHQHEATIKRLEAQIEEMKAERGVTG